MSFQKIEITPIRITLVQKGADVARELLMSATEAGLNLQDEDIVAVADKILAIAEGRVVDYTRIEASPRARQLAEKFDLEPGFVELVLREAERVYGGVQRALLTMKHGVLIAHA